MLKRTGAGAASAAVQRIAVLGSFLPAGGGDAVFSAALVRGLRATGHAVCTLCRRDRGRAETVLPRRPGRLPEDLGAWRPDFFIEIESQDPRDARMVAPGFSAKALLDLPGAAIRAVSFRQAVGRVAARRLRVIIAPAGGKPSDAVGRKTLRIARSAVMADPTKAAAALIQALDLGAPDGPPGARPAGDVALLSETWAAHDFSRHALILRIRKGATTGRAPGPFLPGDGPRTAMANAPEPGMADAKLPMSRFMAHARAALRVEEEFDLADPWQADGFARWYLSAVPKTFRGMIAPVSDALRDHLAQDAAPPGAGLCRVSRLLAAEATSVNPTLLAAGRGRAIAEWWYLAHEPARRFHAALTPDYCRAEAARVPAAGRGQPFDMPEILWRALVENEAYRKLYPPADPSARVAFVYDQLLNSFDTPIRAQRFDGPVRAWFAGPVDGRKGAVSRFELLTAFYCAEAATSPEDLLDPAGSDAIRHWFRATVCAVHPPFEAFATKASPEEDRAFELIGMAGSESGLGANLWMSAEALARAGVTPRIRNADQGFSEVPARAIGKGDGQTARKAALVHLNADAVPQVLCHPLFDRHPDLYAIGFLLWEFDRIPDSHRLAMDMLDEIWCPSTFLSDVYARETGRPVRTVLKGLELPEVAPMSKQAMGVEGDEFTFLVSFDFHSSVERKNPLAGAIAFTRAFQAGEKVRLIVKTTQVVRGHWGDPHGQWPQIAALAEADPRIRIVADKMAFDSYLGMIKGCDCLVSPHRAEGFGYLPAYALIFGRPVIATDYSGTADFITADTGYPVAWHRREVRSAEAMFPIHGASWADIDADALAAAMRSVYEDRETAVGRAARGQALMRDRFSVAAQAERYRVRLREIGILA